MLNHPLSLTDARFGTGISNAGSTCIISADVFRASRKSRNTNRGLTEGAYHLSELAGRSGVFECEMDIFPRLSKDSEIFFV